MLHSQIQIERVMDQVIHTAESNRQIHNLNSATLFVLAVSEQVIIEDCKDSFVFVGPCGFYL
jgi:hypothetical protein